jgi:hypothetical protein
VREIRMLRSNGRQLETEPGRTLHGHEAGNGGYSQGDAYRHRASSRPYLSLSRDPYSVRERKTGNPSTTALGPPSNSALTLTRVLRNIRAFMYLKMPQQGGLHGRPTRASLWRAAAYSPCRERGGPGLVFERCEPAPAESHYAVAERPARWLGLAVFVAPSGAARCARIPACSGQSTPR